MFSAVLALVLAFHQQDTVRVGGKPDSAQAKRSRLIRPGRARTSGASESAFQ